MAPDFLILVGGLGTRLREVVHDVPKPMAPVGAQPFLQYVLSGIRREFPVARIILLTHHLAESIQHFVQGMPNVMIVNEDRRLGTGGAVQHALSHIGTMSADGIVVLNGDTYTEVSYRNLVRTATNDISIVGTFQADCSRYGRLTIANNCIIGFHEKVPGVTNAYINSGVTYFKTLSFFDREPGTSFSLEEALSDRIAHGMVVGFFQYDGVFFDIGVPEDYYGFISFTQGNYGI